MANDGDGDRARLKVVDEPRGGEPVARLGDPASRSAPTPPARPGPQRLTPPGPAPGTLRGREPDIEEILPGAAWVDPEGDWQARPRSRPVPYGWFALILVLIAGVLLWGFGPAQRATAVSSLEVKQREAEKRLARERTDDREAVELVEAIERALDGFLGAESVEEMLPWVREPERVAPLMREWHAERPKQPLDFVRLGVFHPFDVRGRPFWLTNCVIAGGAEPPGVLLEQLPDGRARIDWETFVCHQPMDWDRFVRRRPEGRPLDFRVHVEPDRENLHSHEFSDEEHWEGYRLSTRDAEEYLFGYVEREREAARRIERMVRAYGKASMLLRLEFPEGSRAPRGVRIREVVAENWVFPSEGGGVSP